MSKQPTSNVRRKAVAAAAVVGTVIGAVGIAGAVTSQDGGLETQPSANAVESNETESNETESNETESSEVTDERDGRESNEELLTGSVADQATAAAEAAVPGGTVDRVETDDDGAAYEAHMTDADGQRVTVHLDESFAVIDIETGH